MAIITISRELAALGDETAHALATQLNYRLVGRQALEERIKSFGIINNKFQKYDEKKPTFWASLSHDRDDYLHFLKTAILTEAGQENAVFIGRGAATILKSVQGVFSVFLTAPQEIRMERVKSYFRCDDKRAAQIIEQSDQDREGFHRYFFDVKWKEAGNYHLALNTGHLHPEICAEIIKYMRDRLVTEESEVISAKKINELMLEQTIKHGIVYDMGIPIHFLEASVSENRIILYGVANARTLIEAAVSVAEKLAPEYSVQSEIQVMHEYSIIP